MTRQEEMKRLSASRDRILEEIRRIDLMLDDDSISNEEFDHLSRCAAELQQEEGHLYQRITFLGSGAELRDVSQWLSGFLASFPVGTRKITIKQAQVFQRIPVETVDGYKTFWIGNTRYRAEMPNYRNGFSGLIVSSR